VYWLEEEVSRFETRINALENLDKIAQVLGAEWTRTELIPYVSELLDDDDLVMISLAENLAKLTPHIGGSTKAKFLLKPLE